MQGLAFLVTFGAMPKVTGPARPWSAWVAKTNLHFVRPFDKLRANGGMHRSNELLTRRIKPVVEGLELGRRRRLAASIVTAGQELREWPVASARAGCMHSPEQED